MCQNPLVKTNINIAIAFLLFVFAQKDIHHNYPIFSELIASNFSAAVKIKRHYNHMI